MKGHPGPHDLCARFEGRSIPFHIKHALLQGRTLSLPRPPAVCWTRFGWVASGWGPSQGAPLPAPVCRVGPRLGEPHSRPVLAGVVFDPPSSGRGHSTRVSCSHTLPWAGRAAREVPVPSSRLCSPPADGQGARLSPSPRHTGRARRPQPRGLRSRPGSAPVTSSGDSWHTSVPGPCSRERPCHANAGSVTAASLDTSTRCCLCSRTPHSPLGGTRGLSFPQLSPRPRARSRVPLQDSSRSLNP